MPSSALADLSTGVVVGGRYEVLRAIGRGGMGTVFEARDLRLGRRLALKVLNPAVTALPNMTERFLREAQMMAAIDSPYVVPVYDVGSDDGRVYLAMKLFAGKTLHHRQVKDGRMSELELLRIAQQVLLGLQQLHDSGIVHRDIKPENVAIDARGNALLLDLGLAVTKKAARLTMDGLMVGTPEYMSPEQRSGDKAIDPRVDLYALAATMYEMLSGRPPRVGGTTEERATPISEIRESISREVDDLILRGLSRSKNRRFKSAAEMRAAVEHQIEALEEGHLSLRRRRERRNWFAAVAMTAAFSAAAGAMFVAAPEASPRPAMRVASVVIDADAPDPVAEDVVDALELRVASDPADGTARLMLARAYERAGRHGTAATLYERFLELEPASPKRAMVEAALARLRHD